jgi:hypothetical protein
MGVFQLRNHVKAEIFQPNQFRIIVYGYPSSNHNIKKGMKTAQVYLETPDGKSIKFCPEGEGRYVSKCPDTTGEFDLEKDQPFTIKISHNNYNNREINFLRYPFAQKGSAFTFYLFKAKAENYQIDSSYAQQGLSLFCENTYCNSTIDQAVSYYELAKNSLDEIPDLETKKKIIYNLARAKLAAWTVLEYDTCNQAYNYYSKLNSLLGDTQTNTNNEFRYYLVSIGYLMKDQKTIQKKEDFCKK